MTDLRIDHLTAGHAPNVLDVYLTAASVERSGLARTRYEMSIDYVQDFLCQASRGGIALGAFQDSRLVGELHEVRLGPRQFDHVLTGLTVAVHPAAQGGGIGQALFAQLFRCAAEADPPISRIELIARSGNAGALRLYQRLGFVEEGRFVGRVILPDGQMEDDIAMTRRS